MKPSLRLVSLSEQLFAALREEGGADLNGKYVKKLNRLTVESWRKQAPKRAGVLDSQDYAKNLLFRDFDFTGFDGSGEPLKNLRIVMQPGEPREQLIHARLPGCIHQPPEFRHIVVHLRKEHYVITACAQNGEHLGVKLGGGFQLRRRETRPRTGPPPSSAPSD